MNQNNTYYNDLIARYLFGELAESELHVFSEWLKADPENEKLFLETQKVWSLVEQDRVHSTMNTENEWIAMKEKMQASGNAEMNKIEKVVLLNQDKGKSVFQRLWKVAAAVIVLLVSSFFMYYYFAKPATVVVIAQGTNIEQILPDGSVVSLHSGSQLSYPEKFNSSTRNVELKGEAYFNVAHDNSKPFIVASGEARIKVLGTQFNMNTLAASGNMEVVLTSGKVSVYYKADPEATILLMPGEKAEIHANQKQIHKSSNADPNYMAWKTRMLVFDNETLGQVAQTLQHVYQTKITFADSQLSACRVTASFNDQSLESVLQVLKQTLDLQVKTNDKTLELSGKGCR